MMNERNKKPWFNHPLHVVLLSIYPILYLYAANIVSIPFKETLRFLGLSLGFALLFLFIFRLILKDWGKAGLASSLLVLLFYSFGHVANIIDEALAERGVTFSNQMLLWVWGLTFLLVLFLIFRTTSSDRTTRLLNLVSGILILFPILAIVSTIAGRAGNDQTADEILAELRDQALAERAVAQKPQSEMPDIYYLIFDAYERADKLAEFYDYDNSPFINELEDRGFFAVSSSRSNFLNTTYSLNTSLNLVYFSDFPMQVVQNAKYNLEVNYVSDFLRERGYQVVVFDSGTGDSNNQYSDIFIAPPSALPEGKPAINRFEQLMLRTTIGFLLFEGQENPENSEDLVMSSINQELDIRRDRIENAFAHIADYAQGGRNSFVFSHFYLPHIPLLYGAGGEDLKYHGDLNLYWYEVPPENFVEYYGYQIDFLNREILMAVDKIMAQSKRPLVIVLQSDHGDDKYLDWSAPTAEGVDIRSANFTAIYFSDGAYEELYPTITPVNIFRVVLNHWFGTQYPLLQDQIFFHEHTVMTPFNSMPEFLDACADFEVCLPPPP